MHKKTHITIHLEPHETAQVNKGDTIKRGQTLLASRPVTIHEFDLAEILKINPKKLKSYLKISEGKQVKAGDVIAQKSSLFGNVVIKAPMGGEFVIANEQKGLVAVKETHAEKLVTAWFDGTVEEINAQDIVVGVSGVLISGESGKGKLTSGSLYVIMETIDAFEIPTELEQTILVVKNATSDMIAKADTLGAVAIVTESIDEPKFALPYLLLSDIKEVHAYHKKNALLYGDKLELLILEDSEHHSSKSKHETRNNP